MKSTKKLIAVLILLFACVASKISAQESDVEIKTSYIYSNDSIVGFDEQAASAVAIENAIYGQEFKYFMYEEKRKFIIQKYNIILPVKKVALVTPYPAKYGKSTGIANKSMYTLPSSGACTNEDFEDAQSNPGPQFGGVVNGWSLFEGIGSIASSFCTPSALVATSNYIVYNSPVVDGIMIAPNNTVSSYFDATSLTQPAGNCFIKLQDGIARASVSRLSKTYTISSTNALFRYAYRAVISNPPHACCSQPGFKIQVTITNTTSGTSTVLACPNITVVSGSACGTPASGFSVGNFLNGSPSAYNASWVPGSIDLSGYLGDAVTLNVFAIDCNLSGHAAYVYFDALCAPMTILGNSSSFPAGSGNITLPTCGASGATITAPPGLGPYTWTSTAITIPANLSVPNTTNTTLITNQSGTLALTMNPPGSCAPIVKIITVTITPTPQALITTTQASCTNPLACVSLTTAGSATLTSNIIWSPAPGSLSSNSLLACGLPVGPGSVTVYDTFSCQVVANYTINAAPPAITFTLVNNTGSFSLTCINPTINLSTSTNYTYGPLNYNWINSGSTVNSSLTSVNLTGSSNVGNYTVSLSDPSTGCVASQTFAIGQNTAVPVNNLSPASAIVNCNTTCPTFTSTVTSPTANITTNWYNPGAAFPSGPSTSSSGTVSISNVCTAGQVTVVTINNVNGCSNTKFINITTTSYYPTFSIGSTTNFTLGCGTTSLANMGFASATSTNGPVQFAFLPPSSTLAIPIPTAGNFSSIQTTNTPIPGAWTMIVLDVISGCQAAIPVVILANTAAPDVSAGMLTQTLTCFNPTVLAVGTSSTPNTILSWLIPSPPFSSPSPSVIVGVGTGPLTNTNLPNFYATYTAVATNSVNQCRSTQNYTISQNFFAPANIIIGTSTPSFITCQNQCVNLTFNSVALSYTGGIATASNTWISPPPSTNTSTASSYSACFAGNYTLTVMDSKSGCTASKVQTVTLVTNKPVLANLPVFTLDCNPTASLSAALIQISLTNTLSGWSVFIGNYPGISTGTPAAFSNSNLATPPNGMSVTPASALSTTFTVDKVGLYGFIVRNSVTGCTESGEFTVTNGTLNADFSASPLSGYAPLNVSFTNLSASSSTLTGSTGITSVWNFGNGTAQSNTLSSPTSANYTTPGTYTVTLISKKGTCIDSAYKIIRVDIPSKLDVPNVFTPNGDGSNDVFFLKTSNLTEITALIFDRWGNKVYDLTSSTGNIAWDGKNQEGKEAPAGTYFYIIKATGKDGITYDKKGNVSLYR